MIDSMYSFQIDFNEMLEPDLLLLSKSDIRINSSGQPVLLSEGMNIKIWDDDIGDDGQKDNIVAFGKVERNPYKDGWSAHVKWCCRVDERGILHQSEIDDVHG